MARDPYKYFRIEARDLQERLSKAVLELEKGPVPADLVPRLLRLAHTLKGAARVVNQVEIADLAHAIEDALAPCRDSAASVPRELIDTLLTLLDGMHARITALALPPSVELVVGATEPVHDDGFWTVQADVAEMDALLDGAMETHVQLDAFRKAADSLGHARLLAELLVDQTAARGIKDGGRQSSANPDKVHSLAEELRDLVGALERSVGIGVGRMDGELRQLRDVAEQMRLVPAATLFTPLERTVRDVAQALGKQVALECTGGEVRLDAHVLGTIHGALLQLVKNAAAHGIESAADRRIAGKPVAGRVTIDVARRGHRAVFTCRDDGCGVDVEGVRRAALRRGLASADTRRLDAGDLLRLLLRGGITTASTVTEVSGRGIGLDVVREAAERLGGQVTVATERGRGTTFELTVPLSLTSIDALLVEASGVAVAIPLDAVRQTMRVAASDISRTTPGDSVVYGGAVIPFVPLGRALRIPTRATTGRPPSSGVVVEGAAGLAVVGVDRIRGTSTVVVRPVPAFAAADPTVGGAFIDAEGNPQLVLDADGLVAEARRERAAGIDAVVPVRAVLVIDDSLTTRMLEQSILESAGYDVDTATSGEDALDSARLKHYALFLVDVEMPGMDGFTFIEHARLDPLLRDTPAILVTSRDSPEDRQRGQRVGAQGYINKNEFDQADLLARIHGLVA